MLSDPTGKLIFGQVGCGQVEHYPNGFELGDVQVMVVHPQESVDGHERYSLVAVKKAVILDETVAARRREIREVGALLVSPLIPGSIHRRLEQPLLADAKTSAVLATLVGVDDAYDRA